MTEAQLEKAFFLKKEMISIEAKIEQIEKLNWDQSIRIEMRTANREVCIW